MSLASFFGEVIRIGSPDYLRDVADVLRARQKSVGIMGTRFTVDQRSRVFRRPVFSWLNVYQLLCWQNTYVPSRVVNGQKGKNGYTVQYRFFFWYCSDRMRSRY
jgi:hypothetical protein